MEFDYKIISKGELALITLSGKLSRDAKDKLESCRKEIEGMDSKVYVIVFKEVNIFDNLISREFTLLQQEARKRGPLYLVGLSLNFKLELSNKGLIRLSEVRNSLEELLHRGH